MLIDILKETKFNHFIKNIIIFFPIILSTKYTDINLCIISLIGFIAYCLISYAVYIMNDIIDIEEDKLHPIKCKRLIASGKISKTQALIILFCLFGTSIIISLYTNLYFLFIILGYFILNIFYSFYLKNIPIVDMACIAVGFILRILAGYALISIEPAPLIIVLTFFVSIFFTSTKRKLEFQVFKESNIPRKAVKGIDISTINHIMIINAALSIIIYSIFILDKDKAISANSSNLYWTIIPFSLLIFRMVYLVMTTETYCDPMHLIEKDYAIKVIFILYLVIFTILLTRQYLL